MNEKLSERRIRAFGAKRYDAKRSVHDTIEEIAVEEPLEITVAYGPEENRNCQSLSVTMRTPGNDDELAVGFLFTEGIISGPNAIQSISRIGLDWLPGETSNAIRVEIEPAVAFDTARFQRHFYTSSSCGICGKASIDSVRSVSPSHRLSDDIKIDATTVLGLPRVLRSVQTAYDRTGGLHASGLFETSGRLLMAREDVGRHNALDKIIGANLLAGKSALHGCVLLLSGRASFELVQKAIMAQIPIVAAVGAPSTLAVELATEFGVTLIGFVREDRFNVYSDDTGRVRY